MTHSINRPITVTAVRFTKDFETIPRRIELDGISYELGAEFRKVALQTANGTESLLEISDGTQWFQLRMKLDSLCWQLLSMTR